MDMMIEILLITSSKIGILRKRYCILNLFEFSNGEVSILRKTNINQSAKVCANVLKNASVKVVGIVGNKIMNLKLAAIKMVEVRKTSLVQWV